MEMTFLWACGILKKEGREGRRDSHIQTPLWVAGDWLAESRAPSGNVKTIA